MFGFVWWAFLSTGWRVGSSARYFSPRAVAYLLRLVLRVGVFYSGLVSFVCLSVQLVNAFLERCVLPSSLTVRSYVGFTQFFAGWGPISASAFLRRAGTIDSPELYPTGWVKSVSFLLSGSLGSGGLCGGATV